jgi:hypothetical protein
MSVELKMNQCRHMILAIAGNACHEKTNIDVGLLLKLLAKISTGNIRKICQKLLKDKQTYINKDIWMFAICWKLSLDKTENLTIL